MNSERDSFDKALALIRRDISATKVKGRAVEDELVALCTDPPPSQSRVVRASRLSPLDIRGGGGRGTARGVSRQPRDTERGVVCIARAEKRVVHRGHILL